MTDSDFFWTSVMVSILVSSAMALVISLLREMRR